ncbi:MAG: hypothetical protein HC778_03460 [Chamaesiphon sp. CSU_1_12]|nr:hypothetical protein [Chamaesiphon sp. CSU_1_12]
MAQTLFIAEKTVKNRITKYFKTKLNLTQIALNWRSSLSKKGWTIFRS